MTAPTIERLIDLDEFVEAFEEPELPCEIKIFTHAAKRAGQVTISVPTCGDPASHVARFTCHCDHVHIGLICDRHAEAMRTAVASGAPYFLCPECKCMNGDTDRQIMPL